METLYADPSLEGLETGERGDGGYPPGIVKAFRRRMGIIRNALDERDIRAIKGNRLEKLAGDRSHQHSVRLNDQWRLILEFKGEGNSMVVLIVGIEDYH